MSIPYYDAHNHLQDDRLAPHLEQILTDITATGVAGMVINGSCEEDWPQVAALASRVSGAIPSFGYHPWYVRERTPEWKPELIRMLDSTPSAIGEIGLDKWIRDHDLGLQEEAFVWQLRLASERNLPVSIHCLQAWGRLLELLKTTPLPSCGFVLHSYGGPAEMIQPLAELGACFSLPGYFAHERKVRQREVFRQVPPDRLLIETDAPDQSLPPGLVEFELPADTNAKPVNHPANLRAVYRFASQLLELPLEPLAAQVRENFLRIFGGLCMDRQGH